MADVVKFVEDFLSHYASQYYDPAKAHEYYLKNRELQGRRSGSDLKSQAQKEAWDYAKNQIGEAKQRDLQTAATANQANLKQIHDIAKQRQQAIGTKIKALMDKINADAQKRAQTTSTKHQEEMQRLAEKHQKDAEKIAQDAKDKLSALPAIPKGIPPELRDRLVAQRSDKVARIQGDAQKSRKDLDTKYKADTDAVKAAAKKDSTWIAANAREKREKQQAAGTDERTVVSTQLKATVDKARADYESLKEKLKARYETTLDTEFNKIKEKV